MSWVDESNLQLDPSIRVSWVILPKANYKVSTVNIKWGDLGKQIRIANMGSKQLEIEP